MRKARSASRSAGTAASSPGERLSAMNMYVRPMVAQARCCSVSSERDRASSRCWCWCWGGEKPESLLSPCRHPPLPRGLEPHLQRRLVVFQLSQALADLAVSHGTADPVPGSLQQLQLLPMLLQGLLVASCRRS